MFMDERMGGISILFCLVVLAVVVITLALFAGASWVLGWLFPDDENYYEQTSFGL